MNDEQRSDRNLLESASGAHWQVYPDPRGPAALGTSAFALLRRSPAGPLEQQRPEADLSGSER